VPSLPSGEEVTSTSSVESGSSTLTRTPAHGYPLWARLICLP
jgi:hypothetical protein